MKRKRPDSAPVTIERIERAMVICAKVIELDGDKYLPLYLLLETKLDILKSKEDALARARSFLEANRERFPEVDRRKR